MRSPAAAAGHVSLLPGPCLSPSRQAVPALPAASPHEFSTWLARPGRCPGPTPALRASVPPAALPARPWLHARRAPLSGRGKMPAAGQEVQAVPHPQALVGCGDSTLRTLQGSKLGLFQFWS